jgi:hypothetical protein
MNAYKVLVTFDSVVNSEALISCEALQSQEWRIQKSWEVNISYGIIRDIEVDLSIEELKENIVPSNKESQIIDLKRLRRISSDETSPLVDSEIVRIGFKGTSLPEYIYLFDMRVKVEPYIFPVTQCSRCWRFGHVSKMCMSNKIICPKCTQYHPNCETTTFKCVNCHGNHMSLYKSCPVYLKERQIRKMMSDHNCTYRKALTMYIQPLSTATKPILQPSENHNAVVQNNTVTLLPSNSINENITYATVTAIPKHQMPKPQKVKAKKRKQRFSSDISICDWDVSSEDSREAEIDMCIDMVEPEAGALGASAHDHPAADTDADGGGASAGTKTGASAQARNSRRQNRNKSTIESNISFGDFLRKLKEICFSKSSGNIKIQKCVQLLMEWVISIFMNNLSDVSIFKWVTMLFNSQDGQ